MNTLPISSESGILKLKLLISNYQKHLLEQENKIFRDEIEYLSNTEENLRQQLHQQYKNFKSKTDHLDCLFE